MAVCASFGLLGFLNLSKDGETVFNWLLNITAVAGFITWSLINICHLRFMKVLAANGKPRSELPYIAPFQPYLSWFGLFFNVLILITSGFTVFMDWNTSNFFASYISVILFVALYVGHKLVYRTKAGERCGHGSLSGAPRPLGSWIALGGLACTLFVVRRFIFFAGSLRVS